MPVQYIYSKYHLALNRLRFEFYQMVDCTLSFV